MPISDLVLGLKLDDGNFTSGLDKAKRGVKSLDNQKLTGLRKSISGVGLDLKGLKSSVMGFAGSIGKVAGPIAAIAGIGAAAGMAANKAMAVAFDARGIDAQLTNSLSKIGQGASFGALNALSGVIQKAFVFDDEEVRSGFKVLIDGGMDAGKAMKSAALVADVARAKNMEYGAAADVVSKAFNGELRALKSVGLFMQSTGDRTKDAALAQDMLRQKFGGAAAAAAKAQSPLDRMGLMLGDTVQLVGEKLLPVLEPMMQSFGNMFAGFADSGGLEEWVTWLVDGFKTAADFGKFLWTSLEKIDAALTDGTMGDFLIEVIKEGMKIGEAALKYLGGIIWDGVTLGVPILVGMIGGKLAETLRGVVGEKMAGVLGLGNFEKTYSYMANSSALSKAMAARSATFAGTSDGVFTKLAKSASDRFSGDASGFSGGAPVMATGMQQAQQQAYGAANAPTQPDQHMQAAIAYYNKMVKQSGSTTKIQLISQQPMSAATIH